MARIASAAVVAALLVATAVAFAYTEKLKLTPSPILGTRVDKVFSPVCDCERDTATVFFRLRDPDLLSVDIVDDGRNEVRQLVNEEPVPSGPVTVVWDGRDDAGRVVSEGSYRARVRLADEHRTILLPNPIRVDVTPPSIELLAIRPRTFSPDGDGRADRVAVRYRINEPAGAILYVDGARRVVKRGRREEGTITWFGRVAGKPLPPGGYALSVGARDVAGNLAARTRPRTITIRYVSLGRNRIEAVAGRRFAVFVSSDAARIEWRLATRTGTAKPGTLRLRAPLVPGRYTLTVTTHGHTDRATVIVREAPS